MRFVATEPPNFGTDQRWREIVSVRLRLATPMLGGGSVPGWPDLDQPFRPSSIRGALRRWWRATTPFISAADMKKRERELWGMVGPDGNSSTRIRIEVDADPVDENELCGIGDPDREGAAWLVRKDSKISQVPFYAVGLFASDLPKLRALAQGREFAVRVMGLDGLDGPIHQALQIEVATAVAAWLEFGGVGMRSRRGFGTLEVQDGKVGDRPAGALLSGLIKPARLRQLGQPFVTENGFTLLPTSRLFLKSSSTCDEAWAQAVRTLSEFCRGVTPGATRPYKGNDSHSPWPEVDAIRDSEGGDLFLEWEEDESIPIPRAELGLPRNFNSARKGPAMWSFHRNQMPGTDQNTRLSSPVVTKPIRRDGRWHAGILLMHRGQSRTLNTDAYGFPDHFWEGKANGIRRKASDYRKGREPKGDILDVLADYLGCTGWQGPI